MLLHAMNNRWPGAPLMRALGCLFFVAALRCEAQNLVPNPSFELQDTCPYAIGFQGASKPLYWDKWNESPEYFDACVGDAGGADTLLDVPLNGFGYQYAWDGEAYVGMYAYNIADDFREHVGCELLTPLVVGQPYYLSFRTNVAMGGTYWAPVWACNNMGMLFTMQPNVWTDVDQPPFALRNYAHLHSTTVLSDTADWTLISGTFVADSAYPYLVLGNFFSDALTDTAHLMDASSLGAYYFVDEVCVSPSAAGCPTVEGIEGINGPAITIGPNPADKELMVVIHGDPSLEWWLMDSSGRVVERGRNATERLVIPLHTQLAGCYVLRLKGKSLEKHLRFVVMH